MNASVDVDVDVVVVGAGPVGLCMAAELKIAGCSVVVLERRPTPDETIKAGGIGAACAEALARRGLLPQLLDAEQALFATFTSSASGGGGSSGGGYGLKSHFAGLRLLDPTLQDDPSRRAIGLSQLALERVLTEHASRLGVEIRRGVEVTGFAEDAAANAVMVKVAAVPSTSSAAASASESHRPATTGMTCSYLVGCDGGRSFVRKAGGFDFLGTDPTITAYQAIVVMADPEKLLPYGWRRTDHGMLVVGPIPGRVMVVEFDGPPKAARNAPVTVDELQAALRRVSRTDVTVTSIQTATRYTDHARLASTFRRGRVFIAGDAAHVHSPFGGQGLNLGVNDAVNLGWKLAAVLQGRIAAVDELLDAYTAERRPVAASVLENTRAQTALMRPGPHAGALRDTVAHLLTFREPNRYMYAMMSGISARYDLGSVTVMPVTHPLLGLASPNLKVVVTAAASSGSSGGSGGGGGEQVQALFDIMHDGAAVLLDLTDDGRYLQVARAKGFDGHNRVLRAVHALRCLDRADFGGLFVRADGFVAWTGQLQPAGTDVDDLGLSLRRWLGRA